MGLSKVLKEGDDLCDLSVSQVQRFQLAVTGWRCGSRVVVIEQFFKRYKLTSMHDGPRF